MVSYQLSGDASEYQHDWLMVMAPTATKAHASRVPLGDAAGGARPPPLAGRTEACKASPGDGKGGW